MTTTALKQLKIATISGFVLALGFAGVAKADHNSRFSCYAYVHDQCYGENSANCSQDEYEWGLNECDGYYPSSKPIRKPTFGVLAPTKKKSLSGSAIFSQSAR